MDNKYIEYSPDDEIFKLLDPYSNTKLSKLKGYDLQDILLLIDKFYLIYRKKLGFDKNITFGFEIEVENAKDNKIEDDIDSYNLGNWKVTEDGSLYKGVEIISPILSDKKSTWEDLQIICTILKHYASVGKTTGSHIHVGSQILGSNRKYWLNLMKLWSVYENIIYRFLYGEYLSGRPEILEYAMPVSTKLNNLYFSFTEQRKDLNHIIHLLNADVDRYSAISFKDVDKNNLDKCTWKNTIEFRSANGTINPIIWQNNLNMLINMLLYTKDSKYNLDIINKRAEIIDNEFLLYDEIYLDQALEFCDLIFNNNYDKVFFLKQYLKGFEFQDYRKEYSRAKELTKK